MPDKLPNPFCSPVHCPAIAGPAKVCVMAQWFEVYVPKAMQANSRRQIATRTSDKNATGRMDVETVRPVTTIPLRTSDTECPRAICRSEIHPAMTVAADTARYATDPIF